jgi:prepilin-type processing-associated H-X9-DG protein/prepilin-type N-terminal cleavage/methylation domain-containing protein
MTRRTVPSRFAFTLIELLVVIGIICLLAAILFPVFSRVRHNGHRTVCNSNLKQLSIGIIQYTQDYDDRFPLGLMVNEEGNFQTSLDLVQPYLKSHQVAICPSDSDNPDVDLNGIFPVAPGKGLSSYTANDKICPAFEAPVALSEVRQASRLPLIWDAYIAKVDPTMGPFVEVQRRHLDGANCAFVDGHVKWIKTRPELSDPLPDYADQYWNAPPDAE